MFMFIPLRVVFICVVALCVNTSVSSPAVKLTWFLSTNKWFAFCVKPAFRAITFTTSDVLSCNSSFRLNRKHFPADVCNILLEFNIILSCYSTNYIAMNFFFMFMRHRSQNYEIRSPFSLLVRCFWMFNFACWTISLFGCMDRKQCLYGNNISPELNYQTKKRN